MKIQKSKKLIESVLLDTDFEIDKCIPADIDLNKISKRKADFETKGEGANWLSVPENICSSLISDSGRYRAFRYLAVALFLDWADLAKPLVKHISNFYDLSKDDIREVIEYSSKRAKIFNESLTKSFDKILIEASALTPLEKMKAFNAGTRRENLKACSAEKLMLYYNICLENSLDTAMRQIRDFVAVDGDMNIINYYDICKGRGFHEAEKAIELELKKRDLLKDDVMPMDDTEIELKPEHITKELYEKLAKSDFKELLPEIRDNCELAFIYLLLALVSKDEKKSKQLIEYIANRFYSGKIDSVKIWLKSFLESAKIMKAIAEIISITSASAKSPEEAWEAFEEMFNEKFDIICPPYLGADYPPFDKFAINEEKIPHNIRAKSWGANIIRPGEIQIGWETQEPFSHSDYLDGLYEAKRALLEIAEATGYKNNIDLHLKMYDRDETCNILETDSFGLASGSIKENLTLAESIEKHSELNSKLFKDNKLKPEVTGKILEIVDEFINRLEDDGIKFNIRDIILVGSNCSYNYTKDSDLDIHILAETNSLNCPDNLYPKLYSAYRSLFNKNIDIDFYGIPIEVYVQTEETPMKSNGIYSVLGDNWIKEPVQEEIPEFNKKEFDKEFKVWEDRYNKIIKSNKKELKETIDNKQLDEIEKFIEDIYELRKESIAKDGEYSLGNLLFKELRNKGYLDNLKELKNKIVGKELSLESLESTIDQDLADNRQPAENENPELEEPFDYKSEQAKAKGLQDKDLAERLEEKQRYDYKNELSRIAFNQAIVNDNGLFHIYNIKESDVDRIVSRIRNLDYIDWVQKSAGRYDFSKVGIPGSLQPRIYEIYGQIKN